jgi:uncharacterized Zn finger protein (UPF0148 family)
MVFCSNCKTEMKDDAIFCPECGTMAGTSENQNTEGFSQNRQTYDAIEYQSYKLPDIVPEVITPSEGEQKVKQYHCTHLSSRLLGLRAEGVLQVTNKRVIFRASGKSITGNSIIQSEVPVEDVSGISIYKGTYFSLKHFIFGLLLVLILSNFIYAPILGILLLANDQVATVLQWLLAIASIFGVFAIPRKYIWNSILGGIATISFSMIAGSSILTNSFGLGSARRYGSYNSGKNMGWVIAFAVIMLIYTTIALFLYARRVTMSLSIGSKGGSSTPIYISGVRSLGFANNAAPKAIEAEPTSETEVLIRELGALIMDIQRMGDYGIEKWARK